MMSMTNDLHDQQPPLMISPKLEPQPTPICGCGISLGCHQAGAFMCLAGYRKDVLDAKREEEAGHEDDMLKVQSRVSTDSGSPCHGLGSDENSTSGSPS